MPVAGIERVSVMLQVAQVLVWIPVVDAVGCVVVIHAPHVCPSAATTLVSSWSQLALWQALYSRPCVVQAGAVLCVHAPKSCANAGISVVEITALQSSQVTTVTPSDVQVAGVVVVLVVGWAQVAAVHWA